MEIHLKNFRYHREGKYTLPGQSLVLISGQSGKGKSSLLNAISYALYGNIRRPYSHGKTTCQVDLKFQGMKIRRTSRPNRVLLTYNKVEYEDQPAQVMIEKILGMNYREFVASSYVVQRKSNSVLSMTPTEQVKFVETLAFSDDQHLRCKEIFKKEVKKCREFWIRCEAKCTFLEAQLKESQKDLPDVEKLPPLKDLGSLDGVEKEEASLKEEVAKSKKAFVKLQEELERLRKEEKEREGTQAKVKELEIQISSFEQMRSNLGSETPQDDIDKQETLLGNIQTLLSHTKTYEEYIKDRDQVKKLETDHMARLKKDLAETKKKLPLGKEIQKLKKEKASLNAQQKDYVLKSTEAEKIRAKKKQAFGKFKEIQRKAKTRLKSSNKVISHLKEREDKLSLQIVQAKEKINDYTERVIHQEIESYTYQCPSCSTSLRVRGKTLYKSETPRGPKEAYEGLLEKEKKTLETLESDLRSVKVWLQELAQVQSHLSLKVPKVEPVNLEKVSEIERQLIEIEQVQTDVKKLQSDIKKEAFPPAVRELRRGVEIKRVGFPRRFKPKKTVDDLEKEVANASTKLEDLLRVQAERSSLTREINVKERELRSLKKSRGFKRKLKRRTSSDVESEITLLQGRMSEVTERTQELSGIRRCLLQYENLESINALKTKIQEAERNLKEAESALQGAIGLQEAGKEAEIKSLETTIISINEHAKVYLERMFEETIQVRLESFKLTKSKTLKTQMNVMVEYRGHPYDSFDELSGGEKQKCELAFLLAVNDMIGSRIVLLDECLNNLDGEVNMEVLMFLKELAGDKLVLVASHEAVRGVFDKVIKI